MLEKNNNSIINNGTLYKNCTQTIINNLNINKSPGNIDLVNFFDIINKHLPK